jgi:DNA-binding PadR family transcriptional regulator
MKPKGFLVINLKLLRRFQVPTATWDLVKDGTWKTYSGAFPQVEKLKNLGLIALAYADRTKRGKPKNLYALTKKGKLLLELFPENEADEDYGLWEVS